MDLSIAENSQNSHSETHSGYPVAPDYEAAPISRAEAEAFVRRAVAKLDGAPTAREMPRAKREKTYRYYSRVLSMVLSAVDDDAQKTPPGREYIGGIIDSLGYDNSDDWQRLADHELAEAITCAYRLSDELTIERALSRLRKQRERLNEWQAIAGNPILIEHRLYYDPDSEQHYSEYRLPIGDLIRAIIADCPIGSRPERLKKAIKRHVADYLECFGGTAKIARRKRQHSAASDLKRAATLARKAYDRTANDQGAAAALEALREAFAPELGAILHAAFLGKDRAPKDLDQFRSETNVTPPPEFRHAKILEDMTHFREADPPIITEERERGSIGSMAGGGAAGGHAPDAPISADLPEAVRAAQLFESVGAVHFDLKTEVEGEMKYEREISADVFRAEIAGRIEGAESWGSDAVIVRPRTDPADSVRLIQLDDLPADRIEEAEKLAFARIQTSEKKSQAWLAVNLDDPADYDRVRRGLIAHFGADKCASGAGRWPGSKNLKYSPPFDVRIVFARPGAIIPQSAIEHLALVPEPPLPPRVGPFPALSSTVRPFPDWEIERRQLGGGRMRIDFNWALKAIDRGRGIDETVDELMRVSSKAREKGRKYARTTVENAARKVASRGRVTV